jgi:endo-1,4-beta-xylanase
MPIRARRVEPARPRQQTSATSPVSSEALPAAMRKCPFRVSPVKCQDRSVTRDGQRKSVGTARRHTAPAGREAPAERTVSDGRLRAGGLLLAGLIGCNGAGGAAPAGAAPDVAKSTAASTSRASCEGATDLASIESANTSLAQTYAQAFKIGVAINGRVYENRDPAAAALVAAQFNRVTPENELKWQSLERQPGVLDFTEADAFMAYAERHGMEIHGHALVWHHQVPAWVFENGAGGRATREQLLARLEQHMSALTKHFGSRVKYWDVVNEAFNDDGSLRTTPWRTIIGDDYLEQAFRLADEHFPDAKLVYNDFSMEKPGKRDAVVEMVRGFKQRGVRIDAIGTQAHFQLQTPTLEAIDASLAAFASTGAEVLVSELDVDVLPPAYQNQGADLSVNAELSERLNPYSECLPRDVAEQAAQRWADIFKVFLKHSGPLHSVTLWGVSDGHSWLNNWPVRGRTNYAQLFDRQLRPKRSWQRVIAAAR